MNGKHLLFTFIFLFTFLSQASEYTILGAAYYVRNTWVRLKNFQYPTVDYYDAFGKRVGRHRLGCFLSEEDANLYLDPSAPTPQPTRCKISRRGTSLIFYDNHGREMKRWQYNGNNRTTLPSNTTEWVDVRDEPTLRRLVPDTVGLNLTQTIFNPEEREEGLGCSIQ